MTRAEKILKAIAEVHGFGMISADCPECKKLKETCPKCKKMNSSVVGVGNTLASASGVSQGVT